MEVYDMCSDKSDIKSMENELKRDIRESKLSELNPRLSVRVPSDTSVKDVIQIMVDKKIGAVLLVEENKLVGIFSERDIISKIALDYDTLKDDPISSYMTPEPVQLNIDDTIAFALNRMDVGDYRHIPLTDDANVPTGIVAVRDIIRYIDYKCLDGPE